MYYKTISSFLLAALLLQQVAYAGIGSKKAQYVGGTLTIKEGAEGVLSTADTERLIFKVDKAESFSTPYARVTTILYGQHAGRRVGATIAWGITTLGIGALPILFSKKRRHYLTVNFTNDAGKEDAAVFQLGKDVIRTTLASLQARTGKKIEYEDEEARKSGNK
jgi:hypothetical protein